MLSLRETQRYLLSAHIGEGSVVADLTAGNGKDALWLAKRVGDSGAVYAFDVQPQALENTRALLAANGVLHRCTLICDSHHNLLRHIARPLDAAVFNLGWLPGSDRSLTTRRETTLPAIEAALSALKPGGCLLIAIYPGHPEGQLEGEAIRALLSKYSQKRLSAYRFDLLNSPAAPYFCFVETNPKSGAE